MRYRERQLNCRRWQSHGTLIGGVIAGLWHPQCFSTGRFFSSWFARPWWRLLSSEKVILGQSPGRGDWLWELIRQIRYPSSCQLFFWLALLSVAAQSVKFGDSFLYIRGWPNGQQFNFLYLANYNFRVWDCLVCWAQVFWAYGIGWAIIVCSFSSVFILLSFLLCAHAGSSLNSVLPFLVWFRDRSFGAGVNALLSKITRLSLGFLESLATTRFSFIWGVVVAPCQDRLCSDSELSFSLLYYSRLSGTTRSP